MSKSVAQIRAELLRLMLDAKYLQSLIPEHNQRIAQVVVEGMRERITSIGLEIGEGLRS